MSDDGVNRAAVLLMTLGEEASIEVFKYLGPKEVQKLGMEMAKISSIPRERLETVRRYLREAGYSGSLDLVPKGKSEPFTGVDRSRYSAEELYQLDRRVELEVQR